jgi:putative glutamine amidotransferase
MTTHNLKIYCVGALNTANWMRGNTCGSMEKADVVVFPGGCDVNPAMYGEACNPATRFHDDTDARETAEFNKAMKLGKKMVGICRGAQFLCVKAGGKLVQNQNNAWMRHNIFTYDGKIINVTSGHHQAMYPWGMKADFAVLGWTIGLCAWHQGTSFDQELVIGKVPLDMEVELAYFPGVNALCIQPHPEWQYVTSGSHKPDKDAIEYYRLLMDRFMSGHDFKEAERAYSV